MCESMGHIHPQLRHGPAASSHATNTAARILAARDVAGTDASWILPCLSIGVPQEIVPRTMASANARIAKFLIDAKTIRERDIPGQWRDALEVCEKALDAWLKREIGDLHCIAPSFVLRPVADEANHSRASQAKAVYSEVEVAWFQPEEQQWAIGNGLERLESHIPTLGATALDVLDAQSRFVYPLFAPRDAHDIASMLYWYGENDETMAVEEMCGDDATAQAAMREEMVTAKHFTEVFPAWALSWKPMKLAQSELEKITHACDDLYAREIAVLVLALARLRIEDEFRPEIEGEFIGCGAVLSWRDDDLTVRVYDDFINMAHEGEFCDVIGEVRFALSEPATMQAWQRAMRPRFKAMRLIDDLIWRLSQGY